jgi:ADP-ribose pyrophosphatase
MDKKETTLLEAKKFRVVRRQENRACGPPVSQELILHPGAVAMVPMIDADRVCLIKNRRIAVGETLIELPAGTLEPGEIPQIAAARELAEETGYRAGKMVLLTECFMSPGILRERMHIFLATELVEGRMSLAEDEQIEPMIVRWSEAIEMVEDGRIQDAKSIVGLLSYDRMRIK